MKQSVNEIALSCNEESGVFVPVIDRNRCEGKEDCVRVCPYSVFTIQKLLPQDKKELSLRGRLKSFAHGGMQAYVINPDDCHACSLCVTACPEKAITLQKITESSDW